MNPQTNNMTVGQVVKRIERIAGVKTRMARYLYDKQVVTGLEPPSLLRAKHNAYCEEAQVKRGKKSDATPDSAVERAKKLKAERLLTEAKLRRINREMIPTEDVVELFGVMSRLMLHSYQIQEERVAVALRQYPAALAEYRAASDSVIPDTKAAMDAALERAKHGASDDEA